MMCTDKACRDGWVYVYPTKGKGAWLEECTHCDRAQRARVAEWAADWARLVRAHRVRDIREGALTYNAGRWEATKATKP